MPDIKAPLLAHLKHRIATSPLAGPARRLRRLRDLPGRLAHPELNALRAEEGHIAALLPRLVSPGAACLDIGGHYGAFAYEMETLSRGGWLGIVEASPWKAGLLRRRFPRAEVFEVAVSDRDGVATFYENVARPGFSSLSDRRSRGQTRPVRVALARLDALVAAERRIDFIKIDVEGHEYRALCGGAALLARDRPVILFEAGAAEDRDLDMSDCVRLFAWLTGGLGYAIYSAGDLHLGRPPLDPAGFAACRTYPFVAFNFIAVPAGKAPASRAEKTGEDP